MSLQIQLRTTGEVIASGQPNETVQVFEGNWYFAPEAVNTKYLKISDRIYTCSYKGQCYWIDLDTPEAHVENIAWIYWNPKNGYEFIKEQIGFYARNTAATVAVNDEPQAA